MKSLICMMWGESTT